MLPIKYSQTCVLILLFLCLHYASEEAAWPFCLIQALLPTLIRCSVLFSASLRNAMPDGALPERYFSRISTSPCSLPGKLAQPLWTFCSRPDPSAPLPRGSYLLSADQSLHNWQRTKTITLSPFVFVPIAVPVQFDLLFCSICAQATVISCNSPIYFSWSMFNLYPYPTLILLSRSVISYFCTSNCFHHLLAQLPYISQTLWRYNCNIVHYLLNPLIPNIHNDSKMKK